MQEKKAKFVFIGLLEIFISLGCMLVMCYRRLLIFSNYRSNTKNVGNQFMKSVMSKNSCESLRSKM